MKHLFVINPTATCIVNHLPDYLLLIETYFKQHDSLKYDIHVTRWCRDAVSFIRSYVSACDEPVRVHAFGGTGTLYEVINGVIHRPGTEVAAYPLGRSNEFLQYFGRKRMHYFNQIESQVTSPTIPIDVITDGVNCGVANFLYGIEAEAYMDGTHFGEIIGVHSDSWPMVFAGFHILRQKQIGKPYRIIMDETIDISGDYASIMIANTPCYQKKLNPGVDAHPTNGVLDIYTVKSMPRRVLLRAIPIYTSGNYRKMPDYITHYTCRNIRIETDDITHTSFDGEMLFSKQTEFSVLPGAVSFVVPKEIDIRQLPEIYQG